MGGVNLSMKRMCGFEMKNNGLWALSLALLMHLGKLKDTLEILKQYDMLFTIGNNVKLTFYITPRKFFIYFRFNKGALRVSERV